MRQSVLGTLGGKQPLWLPTCQMKFRNVGGIVGEAVSVAKLRRTPESVIVDSAQVDQQMPGHRVATLGDAIDNVLDLQVGDLGWSENGQATGRYPG